VLGAEWPLGLLVLARHNAAHVEARQPMPDAAQAPAQTYH